MASAACAADAFRYGTWIPAPEATQPCANHTFVNATCAPRALALSQAALCSAVHAASAADAPRVLLMVGDSLMLHNFLAALETRNGTACATLQHPARIVTTKHDLTVSHRAHRTGTGPRVTRNSRLTSHVGRCARRINAPYTGTPPTRSTLTTAHLARPEIFTQLQAAHVSSLDRAWSVSNNHHTSDTQTSRSATSDAVSAPSLARDAETGADGGGDAGGGRCREVVDGTWAVAASSSSRPGTAGGPRAAASSSSSASVGSSVHGR